VALRFLVSARRVMPTLETPRLTLRQPSIDDYERWSALRHGSRAFLEPWEPAWAQDELSRGAYRRRIKRYLDEIERDESYPYFLFLRESGALAGGITIGNVRRGVAQTGSIGYWMGEPFAGKGLMKEALEAVVSVSFGALQLNRLEAACVPENDRSRLLLLHSGFRQEGHARSYLKIAGQWRDHLLFARLASDATVERSPKAV
jgi:[ribosomal protein S5]-alanine N-acetyltransferase